MKILQISSAQSLGGGERHLADLANGLAKRGHDVLVALRPNAAVVQELGEAVRRNIITIPLRNSLDVTSAQALARIVKEKRIELVHAHMARDYPLAAYAVRKNSAALIVTRHVLFAMNRMHRVTLAKASRLIAVSHAVAEQLKENRMAPPQRITVVLNGIHADRFVQARNTFDREKFLVEWKLPADALLVGTVGELTRLKGQEDLLTAAAQILKRFPQAVFIIAGIDHSRTGENRERLERMIKEMDLTNNVRLVGWLEDLAQLYCGLDVFVSASQSESFGLVIAEAMASQTAVVATETAGASEIVRHNQTGVLVPINDPDKLGTAVLSLLSDHALRQRLARQAQEDASSRFGVERMIEETETIYKEEIRT